MTARRLCLIAATAWLCALPPLSSAAGTCEWSSPQNRQGLLELYTSEGCNSCPPADQWLSRLKDEPLRSGVVPLAFHVDYWNRLGWPDRFSDPRYTQRQQIAADRNRAAFIYTPQFLLDGRDIRPLQRRDALATGMGAIAPQPAQAHIEARARMAGKGVVQVTGRSRLPSPNPQAQTFIALYENGLVSAVAHGENAGRTLRHDYVVRALVGPLPPDKDGSTLFDQGIALPSDADPARVGVAVFTQMKDSGRVLQVAAVEHCLTP